MEQEKSSPPIKQSEKKKQIWIWILMSCLLLIFIAAIVIFVGGWWIFKNKVQDNMDIAEDQESYFESDQWLNDIDNYFLDDESIEDIAGDLEDPNIINGTKKFVSNEYGFTLNFTENWDDYKAVLKVDEDVDLFGPSSNIDELEDKDMIDQLSDGFVAEYVFYYPTENNDSLSIVDGYEDLFVLSIYRIDDYAAISSGKINELGRNNRYIFTYANFYTSQGDTDLHPLQDIPQATLEDIKNIVEGVEVFDVRVLE